LPGPRPDCLSHRFYLTDPIHSLSSLPSSPPTPKMASPNSTNAAAEASRLQELNADVRNQDDLERDITRQVNFTSLVKSYRVPALLTP
jgi:hypothetical protein